MNTTRFLRKPDVEKKTGYGRTQIERLERLGLFPPRISISTKSVGWPEHEVDAVLAARVAGLNDDQIKPLITNLVAKRKSALDEFLAA